jgi:response regulator NasT
MPERSTERLLVLVANETETRAATMRDVVASLGHHAVVTTTDIEAVAALTADVVPDVALIGVGGRSSDALRLIEQVVQEAACPVIAVLPAEDPTFVNEAARRGVFAYLTEDGPDELRGALDIVLLRFAEYSALEGAFARRAVTERAKGILMERHGIDEHEAFQRLRDHARHRGRRLVDVAEAVCNSHGLLPKKPGDDDG